MSQNRTIPANLCLFFGWVEFPGLGEDLDDATSGGLHQLRVVLKSLRANGNAWSS
jgi:hypothetical protein